MAWTDKRVSLLKKLWKKGLSASNIADELGEGATRNAIIGKAHRLGLSSRPTPAKDTAPAKKPKKAAAPKKPKAAPKPEVPVEPELITILNLTDRMCKWPLGHPGEDDFHFCGTKSVVGEPYCPHHCALAYQAPQPRRDRRRPTGPAR